MIPRKGESSKPGQTSRVTDGTRLPLEDDADGPHVVVRVKPQPADSTVVRVAAAAGLVAAVGFLVFLLAG